VTAETFDFSTLLPILPEIGLVVLVFVLLTVDLTWRRPRKNVLMGVLTVIGLGVAALLAVLFARPGETAQQIWGGMLRLDPTAFIFRLVFLFGAAAAALYALDTPGLGKRGEFYLLLVISTLGMSLMAASADLVMLYLAIETTSIPLYVLAGFIVRDDKSTEAGLKYLLYGAISSAVMLYGFSLLVGFGGSTNIYAITQAFSNNAVSLPVTIGVLMLVLTGLAFKITVVPMHFWAPDVYEGAPTPVTAFLSTTSKAAGFAVLMRLFVNVFNVSMPEWHYILAALAVVTMIAGNVLALTQKNIKRLLAYSSIAQAGTMLIGVAAVNPLGFTGTIYYLVAYLVTNLAAFGVVVVVGKAVGSDEVEDYNGLSRRSPVLALVLLVSLLSLAGIPPFGGFVGKVLVFAAAVQADMAWLAFLGVLNSIFALYYYLNVLKVVYLNRSFCEEQKVPVTVSWGITLGVCTAGIILLGVIINPVLQQALNAALGLM
jgi:NADH-quinone oxidoreductase subunit N